LFLSVSFSLFLHVCSLVLVSPLSLLDALPISVLRALLVLGVAVLAYDYRGYGMSEGRPSADGVLLDQDAAFAHLTGALGFPPGRSEEHTSELQSRENLVCRLLLEKKKPA